MNRGTWPPLALALALARRTRPRRPSPVAAAAALLEHVRDHVRGEPAPIPAALRLVLALASLAGVAAFLLTGVLRLGYPYPLEPTTEGADLQQVEALLQGQSLYSAPTLQHVPLIYGPVYFSLAALAAHVLGVGFTPLRLISLLATAGSLVVLDRLVARETGSELAGLASAGFLAVLGPLADGALDDGRVDALMLFLVLVGVWALRAGDQGWLGARKAGLLGGGCLALALLTKQAALPVTAAALLYLLVARRSLLAACVPALVLGVGVPCVLLQAQSGGWALFYLWTAPRTHDINAVLFSRFWPDDVLPHFTLALCVFAPLFFVSQVARGAWRTALFYGLIGGALGATSWLTRANIGGGANTLLPVEAAWALLFGLGLHAGLRYLQRPSPVSASVAGTSFLLAWAIMQLAVVSYNPRLTVPYRDELWAGNRLAATLAALPGPILAPDFDAFLRGTDKGEQPYQAAAMEILGAYSGGHSTPVGDQWAGQVAAALRAHTFTYVVVVRDAAFLVKSDALAAGYTDAGPLFPPGDEYWLWAGQFEPSPEVLVAPGLPPPPVLPP